jgi:hypothetical protein
LPRINKTQRAAAGAPIDIPPVPPEDTVLQSRYGCLPTFWTIASVLSMVVNIILIAVVFILLLNLGALRAKFNEATGLLPQLYGSFAAMDSATISRVIPVDANIPLNLTVPVTLTGQKIVLTQDTPLVARVEIHTGGLDLVTNNAQITLYRNQTLVVDLAQFNLPVQNNVPVHLDVPVRIPLNETELHQPFVGLRNIVQPYYCLMQPKAVYSGVQVCP